MQQRLNTSKINMECSICASNNMLHAFLSLSPSLYKWLKMCSHGRIIKEMHIYESAGGRNVLCIVQSIFFLLSFKPFLFPSLRLLIYVLHLFAFWISQANVWYGKLVEKLISLNVFAYGINFPSSHLFFIQFHSLSDKMWQNFLKTLQLKILRFFSLSPFN